MKRNSILLLQICIWVIFGLFSGCNEDEKDPCDLFVRQEKSVSLRATVHVLDKDHNPIPNQQVNLYIYKKPCYADMTGKFDYSGPTNSQGLKETSVVSYNLRNTEDAVYVDACAPNLGNPSASENSEMVIFYYDDFNGTSISTKEVDLYIYRNF
jgi:hypothetical protein